ncbi:deoxycytidylate deaminase [Shewanella sp. Choline-02u-19]|uniref:diguanylate cyclase domain-containing protein n=1 Tax=unclassified Shewanella TaxID=196818 RepID=UPI000C324D07|nr:MULTISPECIES: diguanylate cyclase [unclassified Shewanella]PKG57577.1 deoxycytidylate deaminase [Shewanella sp. GutDb-MelDb]PKG73476.1 deoxycytidylate deaminase [Shewanella sp. GutCb]PKH53655.1 deoxycytidylate deaminase [Shewanella sp. Bg11-22]PKI28083.1 deoxycytidylate deaminase [Shewanella sp. Choline-02u-19]
MIYSFSNSGFRDPETGVYNQTYFMEVFNREWHRHIRDHQSLALLYLCPHIHETISQPQLLELFMKQVQDALMRTSDLLARLDNQSFALGIFETDEMGTKIVIDRLEHKIADFNQAFQANSHSEISYELTGCICYPSANVYLETLFETVEQQTMKMRSNSAFNETLIHLRS